MSDAGIEVAPHDSEQERPVFHLGSWYLALGDQLTGYHRIRKIDVEGTVILFAGCLCVSTAEGIFPLQRVAIQKVLPPSY